MRHLLLAALCAAGWSAPAHAADPVVAAMLLDEGDTVTFIEAASVSAETLAQLSLPQLDDAPVDSGVVALQVRSVAQWDAVHATLLAADHAPVRAQIQRIDGDSRALITRTPLSAGRYLLQVTMPSGETLQHTFVLHADADGLSAR